jgi:DNA-binding NarL/FixJ family response regulator
MPLNIPRPIRLLLVEDSHRVQSALLELLEVIGGYELAGRLEGETEATDWIHHHRGQWDLAIVDLILADGSGFNLMKRLKREHPGGRIVVFSEYASQVLKERCISFGAEAVFLKSELQDFVAWLEHVSASRAAKRPSTG